jgi:hypothetical protein
VYRKTAKLFVTSPVNGRSPTDEQARRDPQLFATSAMDGGAEAHSHIAPPKRSLSTVGAERGGCDNLYRSCGLGTPTTRGSSLRHVGSLNAAGAALVHLLARQSIGIYGASLQHLLPHRRPRLIERDLCPATGFPRASSAIPG